MQDLDDGRLLAALAPDGAYERNIGLGAHVREAWRDCRDLSLPASHLGAQRIVVAGMGGSAIAGDFLEALCFERGAMPVVTVRGYALPSWVDRHTLVVACSHSGNTEETLSVFQDALDRLAPVVAVTTGGELLRAAEAAGVPALVYDFPSEPRSAFAHGFVRLAAIAEALGAISLGDEIAAAAAGFEDLAGTLTQDCPEARNLAKQLARFLHTRTPLIVGASILAPAARRWKTQLNENAEVFAVAEELPELHHNTVAGLDSPAALRESLACVLLEPAGMPGRLRERFAITAELMAHRGLPVRRLEVGGDTAVASMLRAVLIGNMVSFYLALLNGVRPAEVAAIDFVKGRLARSPARVR